MNILTEKITHVGADHICYGLNTFRGCSGAVVFLLGKDQSDSVKPEDYGRAITVHSSQWAPSRYIRQYYLLVFCVVHVMFVQTLPLLPLVSQHSTHQYDDEGIPRSINSPKCMRACFRQGSAVGLHLTFQCLLQ